MGNFSIMDIVDILLVAAVMYKLFRIVSKSGSAVIFNGVLAFIILWILISEVLQMRLMGAILDKVSDVGIFVLIIIFQDEIKRFLISLGSNKTFRFLSRLFQTKNTKELKDADVTALVLACMNMAKTHTGALIVIGQDMKLNHLIETGEEIDADISTRLIENIFFKNSPLHDGAMIIENNKIRAAGCILPISQNQDLPKFFGLRHRAALGVSQETDAKVIVISEERGKISFVSNGNIEANIAPERLQEILSSTMKKKKK